MRIIKILLSLIVTASLLISSLLSLSSCSNGRGSTPKSRTYLDYFDTVVTVYDYTGGTEKEFEELLSVIEPELVLMDKLFDIYHEPTDGSYNLASLNRLAGEGPIKLDKRIIDLLSYSLSLYSETEGAVNILFGAVLSIWHKYRSEGRELPPDALLTQAAKHTSPSLLKLDTEAMTAELLEGEAKIDVGATAKGFAEEYIAKILIDLGYSGIVLDFGGNLRTIGEKKNGDGWSTGIKDPLSPYSEYAKKLTLKNEALATSGTYERYYTVNGKRYHHIIDPETLFPSERYLSLSVKSPSAALSDALSTAFFNMPEDKIEEYVKETDGLYVFIITSDGAAVSFGEE